VEAVANISQLSCSEADLVRVLSRGAALTTHADLGQWLQHDVQPWLPHQLLLWAEFRDGIEECAVLSAPSQFREHMGRGVWAPKLMAYFADCWVAAQHTPTRVPLAGCEALLGPDIQALHQRNAKSALVHGVVDRRDGSRRVFAAIGHFSVEPDPAPASLKLFIAVLDTVMRTIPVPPACHPEGPCAKALSERESQIMHWIALGKTNPEIGCILRISEFTVKNHIKSIFSKLDVSNRAQAVAKLTRLHSYA
jgi:transcriptional regulator EpsA